MRRRHQPPRAMTTAPGTPRPIPTPPPKLDLPRVFAASLRRFEHTFRFLKQTPGWTRTRVRPPGRPVDLDNPGRLPQPRLARAVAEDLRHPWHKQLTPGPHRR